MSYMAPITPTRKGFAQDTGTIPRCYRIPIKPGQWATIFSEKSVTHVVEERYSCVTWGREYPHRRAFAQSIPDCISRIVFVLRMRIESRRNRVTLLMRPRWLTVTGSEPVKEAV